MAEKQNHVSAHVILAQQFKRLIRRRIIVVGESIDALLPRCHAIAALGLLLGQFGKSAWPSFDWWAL